MVGPTTRRVALLAIHPEHATAILEGRKTVEFRKRRLASEIEHVPLYATWPMQKVVGYFRIARLDQGSPTSIWQKHGDRGAISRRRFRDYFAGTKTAVAIVVDIATSFDAPVSLRDVSGGAAPPQSFAYLPGVVVNAIGHPRSKRRFSRNH